MRGQWEQVTLSWTRLQLDLASHMQTLHAHLLEAVYTPLQLVTRCVPQTVICIFSVGGMADLCALSCSASNSLHFHFSGEALFLAFAESVIQTHGDQLSGRMRPAQWV